jgi:heme exporter protein B
MLAILFKDLRLELRGRAGVSSLLVLGLLVLLVFQFALPDSPTPEHAAAGMWLSFLFAGTLGAQRTFLLERENQCLDGLLTSPVNPASIYVAKVLGMIIMLTSLQAIVLPLTLLFTGVSFLDHPFALVGVCFLGNVGFSSFVIVFSAVSVRIPAREMMLPLLVFPLLIPLLISAVKASAILLSSRPLADATAWIQVLVAFDLMFAVAGWLLFGHVVQE